MGKLDTIKITILKDGTIKTVTDPISGPNHSSAEEFVNGVAAKLGGEMTAEKRHDHGDHFHYHDDVEHQH